MFQEETKHQNEETKYFWHYKNVYVSHRFLFVFQLCFKPIRGKIILKKSKTPNLKFPKIYPPKLPLNVKIPIFLIPYFYFFRWRSGPSWSETICFLIFLIMGSTIFLNLEKNLFRGLTLEPKKYCFETWGSDGFNEFEDCTSQNLLSSRHEKFFKH